MWSFLSALLITTFAAVSPSAGQETAGSVDERDRGRAGSLRVSTVTDGLTLPWGMAFLPNGDALVSERDSGQLLRISPSGDKRLVGDIPEAGSGEGGLLGIALAPNFDENRLVYAYYTATAQENRVVRFRLGDNVLQPVVTGIPAGSTHNGGRIGFGPDGKLYVATGDAGNGSLSQDPNSPGGKILRVNPTGTVPADNPFPGSRVFSLGHRNVQGLAWDSKGRLFASELGQNTYDEVNRVRAGKNYGWPNAEGESANPNYVDPIAVFPPAEASPSGAAIPRRLDARDWNGDLFVATLRDQSLYKLELDEMGCVTGRTRLLRGQYGRLRHVAAAPNGTLWALTSNGQNDRVLQITK